MSCYRKGVNLSGKYTKWNLRITNKKRKENNNNKCNTHVTCKLVMTRSITHVTCNWRVFANHTTKNDIQYVYIYLGVVFCCTKMLYSNYHRKGTTPPAMLRTLGKINVVYTKESSGGFPYIYYAWQIRIIASGTLLDGFILFVVLCLHTEGIL